MAKRKVSMTPDAELVERLDEVAGESTRSQIVEEALAISIRNRRRGQFETDIEEYYADMSIAEWAEDRGWAERGLGCLTRTWD